MQITPPHKKQKIFSQIFFFKFLLLTIFLSKIICTRYDNTTNPLIAYGDSYREDTSPYDPCVFNYIYEQEDGAYIYQNPIDFRRNIYLYFNLRLGYSKRYACSIYDYWSHCAADGFTIIISKYNNNIYSHEKLGYSSTLKNALIFEFDKNNITYMRNCLDGENFCKETTTKSYNMKYGIQCYELGVYIVKINYYSYEDKTNNKLIFTVNNEKFFEFNIDLAEYLNKGFGYVGITGSTKQAYKSVTRGNCNNYIYHFRRLGIRDEYYEYDGECYFCPKISFLVNGNLYYESGFEITAYDSFIVIVDFGSERNKNIGNVYEVKCPGSTMILNSTTSTGYVYNYRVSKVTGDYGLRCFYFLD